MLHSAGIGLDVHARSISAAAFAFGTGGAVQRTFGGGPDAAAAWAASLPKPVGLPLRERPHGLRPAGEARRSRAALPCECRAGGGVIGDVERIARGAARVIHGGVERGEIVVTRLDLRALLHGIADTAEHVLDLVDDLVDEMLVAQRGRAPGSVMSTASELMRARMSACLRSALRASSRPSAMPRSSLARLPRIGRSSGAILPIMRMRPVISPLRPSSATRACSKSARVSAHSIIPFALTSSYSRSSPSSLRPLP